MMLPNAKGPNKIAAAASGWRPEFSGASKRAVSARELYMGLGGDARNLTRWLKTNILENNFFCEGEDWTLLHRDETSEGKQLTEDYAVTIECAKRLAMMTRTAAGEKVRSYFLNCDSS